MIKRFIILFLVLTAAQASFAKGLDSAYIKTFKDQLMCRIYLDYKVTMLGYSDEQKQPNEEQTYHPNTMPGIGLGVSWHGLAIESKVIGFPAENKDKGKTSYFDLQWHWFMQKLQLSFSLQNYKGFYTEDMDNNDFILLRPDLRIRQFRAFAQYVYNNKKFSYRSGFINDTRQMKSAGSLLFGVDFAASRILADSTLVIGGEDNRPQNIQNIQFGPNLGYVYNFVIKKNYFATASFTAGIGFSKIDKNGEKYFKVYPTIFPRFAGGYHSKRGTVALMVHFSRSYISRLEENPTSIDVLNVQLSYSHRFNFKPKSGLFKSIEKILSRTE